MRSQSCVRCNLLMHAIRLRVSWRSATRRDEIDETDETPIESLEVQRSG
jgi:hypothetical protein